MFDATLPPTSTGAKKQQKREVRWIALPGLTTGTGTPVLGVMELKVWLSSRRVEECSYIVTECETGWDGRAFHLAKGADHKGSDEEQEAYDVFLARNGQDRRCGCKGFERWGECKHVNALAALIAAGKV